MSDRPTPETDALRKSIDSGANTEAEITSFARKLERERDEARAERDETNESSVFSCNFYYEEKLKAERERDEAREALEYIAHAGLSARHIEDYAREFLKRKEAAK